MIICGISFLNFFKYLINSKHPELDPEPDPERDPEFRIYGSGSRRQINYDPLVRNPDP